MSKPLTIIIADTESTVVDALELKFLETLRERVRLEIITDPEYFKEFFASPRTADLLVVGEEMYSDELLRHDIKHRIRVLCASVDDEEVQDTTICVYKYSTAKEIYAEIMHGLNVGPKPGETEKSRLVMVYSPIGGSGKTTVAVGVCAALSSIKRVLYVNAESMNTFGMFMEDTQLTLASEAYEYLVPGNKNIYTDLKPFISRNGRNGFFYLPPSANSLSSAGGDLRALYEFANAARDSGEYDYVIVDVDSSYTNAKGVLMTNSDKVLLIYRQDKVSAYKMDKLQKNVSCTDTEKYIFVCNKYKPEKVNYFLSKKFISTAEIAADKDFPESSAIQIGKSEGIKKLAVSLTFN